MNKPLTGFLLNFGIIFFAVITGPYLLDMLGITGAVPRMLSIGLLAGALTLAAEKIGLLPHLRKKREEPEERRDE